MTGGGPKCQGERGSDAPTPGTEPDDLTPDEFAFAGFTEPRRSDDWRPLGWLAGVYDGLDPEAREMFKSILEPRRANVANALDVRVVLRDSNPPDLV
jgi:hypothetical protein